MRNVLVVASHFDDEALGCGGTVLKHALMGDNVSVVFCCVGESPRFSKDERKARKEHAQRAAEILSIAEIITLDFPLINADTLPQLTVVTGLEGVLRRIRPEIVYTHYGKDINADHRVVSDAMSVWLRPAKMPFITAVYQYEIFASTREFKPNYYVDISTQMDEKLAALSQYTTEIKSQTRSLETIRTLGKYRGNEINTDFAEAFFVYYQIG